MFKIPVGVAQEIERLQREFFWGDGVANRKIHSIDWTTICKSKSKGGLGIGRILDKNVGLLAKWVWRFGYKEHSLWKQVLCAKYRVNCSELWWQWNNSYQASVFVKTIHKLLENGTPSASVLKEGLPIVIGCGNRANFWEDIRWDSIPLKSVFPRIFALSTKKDCKVFEFGIWQGANWEWKIPLRRSLFGLEEEQWKCFLTTLDSVKIRNRIEDTIAWSFNPKGVFSVSSFRKCLESSPTNYQCNTKLIWNGFCPPKVDVFVWNLLKGRTLVKDVLCSWSLKLWKVCMSWWDVQCCHNFSFKEWMEGWLGFSPSEDGIFYLFSASVWTIWESRNQSFFNNTETTSECASDMIKFRVGWWFKYCGIGSQDTITNLMLNLKDLCKDRTVIKRPVSVDWTPPSPNGLKFNVDGSAKGKPGPVGIGGVLRDSRGKILCLFFSFFVGNEDSKHFGDSCDSQSLCVICLQA
ncbi:hypothetical protein LWI28_015677 [Acer negundo]|uniref:Uncharacterized protein n=1 Tax=Acer negundo TaxID=4023 RepID=A0AAD5IFG0_ACENE|nr:hypothetical protein LWI28_015677 [Acer negundo]